VSPRLTDMLCTRCGLCCDGTLFAEVELSGPAEATTLAAMGLDVDEDGGGELLTQPCAALKGTRCGVYAHRPGCCRTFECRLLKDVRAGDVNVGDAVEFIESARSQLAHVHALLSGLGMRRSRLPLRERIAEALAREPSADAAVQRKRDELGAAMEAVEESVRETFLGEGRR
jgi:hypothetical protein